MNLEWRRARRMKDGNRAWDSEGGYYTIVESKWCYGVRLHRWYRVCVGKTTDQITGKVTKLYESRERKRPATYYYSYHAKSTTPLGKHRTKAIAIKACHKHANKRKASIK